MGVRVRTWSRRDSSCGRPRSYRKVSSRPHSRARIIYPRVLLTIPQLGSLPTRASTTAFIRGGRPNPERRIPWVLKGQRLYCEVLEQGARERQRGTIDGLLDLGAGSAGGWIGSRRSRHTYSPLTRATLSSATNVFRVRPLRAQLLGRILVSEPFVCRRVAVRTGMSATSLTHIPLPSAGALARERRRLSPICPPPTPPQHTHYLSL